MRLGNVDVLGKNKKTIIIIIRLTSLGNATPFPPAKRIGEYWLAGYKNEWMWEVCWSVSASGWLVNLQIAYCPCWTCYLWLSFRTFCALICALCCSTKFKGNTNSLTDWISLPTHLRRYERKKKLFFICI